MYIKRRIGKGFLDSLQEKNSTKSIGILGCCKGDGVTTLSIAMANYLAEIMSVKTAIVECNDSKSFETMGNLFMDNDECENSYTIGKVTYYFGVSLNEFFATQANRFEYVIIDFGQDFKNYELNIARLKYRIILGSVMPYKTLFHQTMLERNENISDNERCLHLLYGDQKNVKEYSAKRKINALPAPMIVNPYIIESKLANFFQLLF